MSAAAALAFETRPAYPLGRPADRDRYGMTPEQAILYRWLVKHKPHNKPFTINTRAIAPLFLVASHSQFHVRVMALVDRGWLEREDAGYRFVEPIMIYKGAR